MLSADSCFSVNLLKPNCMTQMKPTVCTKLAMALTLSIPKLIVLGERWFFTEQMRATLVWAWPQTGDSTWTEAQLTLTAQTSSGKLRNAREKQ